jgi:hypothetical protein
MAPQITLVLENKAKRRKKMNQPTPPRISALIDLVYRQTKPVGRLSLVACLIWVIGCTGSVDAPVTPTECDVDEDCDNNLFCDGEETCDSSGQCQAGIPPSCAISCNENLDQCIVDEGCDNGECDGEETCSTCPVDCGFCVEEADYYVSPDGDDTADGSIDHPWQTWGKAFQTAQAGDLVYFRDGVYFSASDNLGGERGFNSGTVDDPIRFFSYPGETPILDCSLHDTTGAGYNTGIAMWHVEHIHLRGLHVRNVLQGHVDVNAVGVALWDVGYVTLENMVVYNVEGEANVVADYYGIIRYINCDAYNLNDALRSAVPPAPGTAGQNGAGFHQGLHSDIPGAEDAQLFYYGCRAWDFSDNGFAGTSVGYVEYDSCWAFDGGLLYGEGCGFKYASTYSGDNNTLDHARLIKNCIGAMNGAYGFSPNNTGDEPLNGHYYNNFAYHNGYKFTGRPWGHGFVIMNYGGTEPMPNEMYANNISYDNELGDVHSGNFYYHEYNSWDLPLGVSGEDFVSLDVSELRRRRKANGDLPNIDFGRLVADSYLVDKGRNVGLPFSGNAPELGCFERPGPLCAGDNVQPCTIENGVGTQSRVCETDGVWSSWSACRVVSCNTDHMPQNNSACSLATGEWSEELVINGGFEAEDLSGWSTSGPHWRSGPHPLDFDSEGEYPQSGSRYLYHNGGDSEDFVYQDVDLSAYASQIDSGNAVVDASGWMISADDGDKSRIQMFFLDESRRFLYPVLLDTGYEFQEDWVKVGGVNFVVPTGARFLRLWVNTFERSLPSGGFDAFSARVGY